MREVRRAEAFQYWAGSHYSVAGEGNTKETLTNISKALEKHGLELVITSWDNEDAYAFAVVKKGLVPLSCKKCPYVDCSTCNKRESYANKI